MTATLELQKLITAGYNSTIDFKRQAMAFARQEGVDLTVKATSGDELTLMHILALNNTDGNNNQEMNDLVVLTNKVLDVKDRRGRTPLQALLDAYLYGECTLDTLKHSATILIRQRAHVTLRASAEDEPSLLHILVYTNTNVEGKADEWINDAIITLLLSLHPEALETKDKRGRTVLQALLDRLFFQQCSFHEFKHSSMLLARAKADTTVRATVGEGLTLMHVLVLNNDNDEQNNKDLNELATLKPSVVTAKDGKGRTALQALLDAFFYRQCHFQSFMSSTMNLVGIKTDPCVRATTGEEPTLLHILVRNNQSGVSDDNVAKLAAMEPQVLKTTDKQGRTSLQALLDAFLRKEISFDVFRSSAMLLARQKADVTVHATIEENPTLLHLLACNNDDGQCDEVMGELVKLNPKVLEATDKQGRTALHALLDAFVRKECSENAYKHSILTLTRQGADVTVRATSSTWATLLQALEAVKQSSLIQAQQGGKESEGFTTSLLHALVRHADSSMNEIEAIIDRDVRVLDFIDGNGQTPLHCLLHNNSKATTALVDKLLSSRNLYFKDKKGVNLLHEACFSGNEKAARHLAEKGVPTNMLTDNKESILHCAVASGNSPLVIWILNNHYTDLNAQNLAGETALHLATKKRDENIVALLIRNGADTSVANKAGQKPFEVALALGYNQLAPSLLDARLELLQKIEAMRAYGEVLEYDGSEKGRLVLDLAGELQHLVNHFYGQKMQQRNFVDFKNEFTTTLHKLDDKMSEYRVAWNTIILNVGIALTGVGLLFLAGQLIYSRVSGGRALFFNQKRQTTCEEKIASIDHTLDQIALVRT